MDHSFDYDAAVEIAWSVIDSLENGEIKDLTIKLNDTHTVWEHTVTDPHKPTKSKYCCHLYARITADSDAFKIADYLLEQLNTTQALETS